MNLQKHFFRRRGQLDHAVVVIQRKTHSMRQMFRPTSIVHDSSSQQPGTKLNNEGGSKSYRLMTQLGLMRTSSPGIYHMLPIAQRSLEKLNSVIDYFMRTVNAQKLQLPTLAPTALWERSGRLGECDTELIKVTDRQSRKYLLSPTHEEAICDLLQGTYISHKQLPLRLYQTTTKFRDEMRPRFGLLRGREFLMKDLYTFDKDPETAKLTYEEVNGAYESLFNYLGVKWIKALGSGGTIGGDTTHEYHFLSPAGEDEILICRNCSEHFNKEYINEKAAAYQDNSKGDADLPKCTNCGSHDFNTVAGIEVGHSFLLGTKYTKPMKTNYINADGKLTVMEMGCYGLGVSRILAAVIEVLSTSTEIRWPLPLSPYSIAIIPPKSGSKEEKVGDHFCEALIEYFEKLLPNDVLLDDRTEFTIGRRFADLKQMGIPYVIILGKRLNEKPSIVEFNDVYKGTVTDFTKDELFKYCYDMKTNMGSILPSVSVRI